MTPPDVSDAAVEAAMNAIHWLRLPTYPQEEFRVAISAAVQVMLRPVGKLPDHALQRLTTIGTVGWDDLFTLESEVADTHTVYVLRSQENAE